MFAVGCIQSQSCHTNRCPTGVATQDPLRQRALDPADKAQRAASFHRNTLHALAQMLAAAGVRHPSELRPHHLARREGERGIRLFSQLHTFLERGELVREGTRHAFYADAWRLGNPHAFEPLSAIAPPGGHGSLLADALMAGHTPVATHATLVAGEESVR
jgi:hypothetical protein